MRIFCLILAITAVHVTAASAQTVLLKSQQQETPTGQFAPPSSAPKPSSVQSSKASEDEAAIAERERREAALNKVKGVGYKPASEAKGRAAGPAMYSTNQTGVQSSVAAPDPATSMTVHGERVARSVKSGVGQAGYEIFTPVNQLHYVQFAVYCQDTPVDKAPPVEGLYLLWHPDSVCPGGAKGASYIVKGYQSREEALGAVNFFKAKKIDCWYNAALTGAEVEVIGVR